MIGFKLLTLNRALNIHRLSNAIKLTRDEYNEHVTALKLSMVDAILCARARVRQERKGEERKVMKGT